MTLGREFEPEADGTIQAFEYLLSELEGHLGKPVEFRESADALLWTSTLRTLVKMFTELLEGLAATDRSEGPAKILLESLAVTLTDLQRSLDWENLARSPEPEFGSTVENPEDNIRRWLEAGYWRPLRQAVARSQPLIEIAVRRLRRVRPLIGPLAELRDEDNRFASHQTNLRTRLEDLTDAERRAFKVRVAVGSLTLVGIAGGVLPLALLIIGGAEAQGLISSESALLLGWFLAPALALIAAFLAAGGWLAAAREVAQAQVSKHARIRDEWSTALTHALAEVFISQADSRRLRTG
ncbi:MAG: hypothetical protein WB789_08245 [Thermoplasmata archaeon]